MNACFNLIKGCKNLTSTEFCSECLANGGIHKSVLKKGVVGMNLTKEALFHTFDKARETESSFVFVGVCAEGTDEVIVIPQKSFDAKEEFYDKAYNNELVHVMNSKVFIRGVSYGEATELNNII